MRSTVKLLDEDDTIEYEITDKEGKATGEFLVFYMKDISLPLKYRDMVFKLKENRANYNKDLVIINKKQDVKEKDDPLSKNEIEAIKLGEDYLKREVEIYNMFLGENGVQKLLCGSPLSWDTLKKVDKLIEEVIMPDINKYLKPIEDMIEDKYKDNKEEELL